MAVNSFNTRTGDITLEASDIPVNPDDISTQDVLHLADRAYNSVSFSGLGYKILRKSGSSNVLTQADFSEANTIYEIRYDFDLNGATITLPLNATLQFAGGSFRNFGNLRGAYTKIVSSAYQIFYYNRTTQQISGTFELEEWSPIWFGAVADGVGYKASYIGGVLTKNTTGIEVIFEGTDNWDAIQKALDCGHNTNISNVILPKGNFRITKPLEIGWGNHSIYFKGSNKGVYGDPTGGTPGGTVRTSGILCDSSIYAININCGRYSVIEDIAVYGYNMQMSTLLLSHPQNTQYPARDRTNYNSQRVNNMPDNGLSRTRPYAGIVTGAHAYYDEGTNRYPLPELPVFIPNYSNSNVESGVRLINVTIIGFSLGYGIGLAYGQTNSDFFKIEKCNIGSNVYGISYSSSQSRNTSVVDCRVTGNWCAITNNSFNHTTNGNVAGTILNTCFDGNLKILSCDSTISPISFRDCYCEGVWQIGEWGTISAAGSNNICLFDRCLWRLNNLETHPLGVPSYVAIGNNICYENTLVMIGTATERISVAPLLHEKLAWNASRVSNSAYAQYNNLAIYPHTTQLNEHMYSVPTNTTYFNKAPFYYIYKSEKYILPYHREIPNLILSDFSYDSSTNLLSCTNTSNPHKPYAGDIIGNNTNIGLYAVVIKREDNYAGTTNTRLTCVIINGYRKLPDASYELLIPLTTISGYSFRTIRTSIRFFATPLEIASAAGNVLTLKNWSSELTAGLALCNITKGLTWSGSTSPSNNPLVITAVDQTAKTITVATNSVLDITYPEMLTYYKNVNNDYWTDCEYIQNLINTP
jgi:hypothetical protein